MSNHSPKLSRSPAKEQKSRRKKHYGDTMEATSQVDFAEPALSDLRQNHLNERDVLYLQRTIGNRAVSQLMTSPNTLQREEHGRGCRCPSCSQVQRKVVQRNGVKDLKNKFENKSVESRFEPATLQKPDEMRSIAKQMKIADFITLLKSHNIAFKDSIKAIIKYFDPVTLADLDPLISTANSDAKKTVWSDSALLAEADTKLGRDSYLTFVTKLGMHHAPTTDELGEGGKEHTPAPEADRLIRDKLSAFVTGAVAAGRKIEGKVAVVSGTDWDKAGINHYGEDVWKNGPPPKTPKKDAINGFVDASGRVWIERNSGNPGTLIHEAIHKYADDTMLNNLGFDFNEGTTEYFTRIICADLSIDRGNYDNQKAVIDSLVAKTSRATVAAAYFDGKVDDLKNAFIKYRKDNKSETDEAAAKSWTDFVKAFDDSDHATATGFLT